MHRARARPPGAAAPPPIRQEPEVVAAFLADAAHVPGGYSPAVVFPVNEDEVAAAITASTRVLAVGAQSSLTGGATPRGELVLSTRHLNAIGPVSGATISVGAGVSLSELQRHLAGHGLWYPPVPTYEGAFVGGTISTNAAGAATFKYGSTRDWVTGLVIVLANGNVLEIQRGQVTASAEHQFEIELTSGEIARVPLPTYDMPRVAKLSAGYFARAGMDLLDLFIGSEGTLGVVVSATLRVIEAPRRCVVLIHSLDDRQAVAVTAALRREAREAWHLTGPLDVAAIEYMDARALATVSTEAFARAGIPRPTDSSAALLLQIEMRGSESAALERLGTLLASRGVTADPYVALPADERGAQRLLELREAVPASVNAAVALAKSRVHPDIQKTAGDMVVPFEQLADSIALYRQTLTARGLDYAIWGHISDGNLHPNVIPRSLDDVRRGQEAILEIARGVIAMGGAPLAEHGVGRSKLKQQLLRELYGNNGIAEMRSVKRALDPMWKLAPGVLFSQSPAADS